MLRSKTPTLTVGLIATLGLISILGPFGSDAYLPALPIMAKELHTNITGVQGTLAAFTVGMAIGQLLMGSFSDALGRRLLIILGPLIMGVASLLGGLSGNLVVLLFSCALIGFSASTGMVVGRALISDLATGLSATRAFSLMGLFVGVGPIMGPLAGALVLQAADWRAVFFFLGILALVVATFAIIRVPESLPKEKRKPLRIGSIFAAGKEIMANRLFIQHAVILWATATIMFAYISSSPFITQQILGFTPLEYTYVFGTNGVGLMITGAIASAAAKRVSPRRIVGWGVAMQLIAAGVLLGTWIMDSPSVWNILPALFLMVSAMGFLFGPATALGLTQVRHHAGTALALQGSIQFLICGVSATVVGLAGPKEFWPLALIVAICSIVSLTFWIRSKKSLLEVL
jgi:DHA1 family bicyclomycin/chloramphenicol resistance-like MFS transporter